MSVEGSLCPDVKSFKSVPYADDSLTVRKNKYRESG